MKFINGTCTFLLNFDKAYQFILSKNRCIPTQNVIKKIYRKYTYLKLHYYNGYDYYSSKQG